jgi:phosphoribosylanthranilate isomerase
MPDKARNILRQLPVGSSNVALFVNATKKRVEEILAGELADGRQAYSAVQFHGEESATFCHGWTVKVIKAFRMKEKNSLSAMKDFPADFYLLDSWSTGYGGSGQQFPWQWLEGIDANKLILSGGLQAENVADAIARIRPFGVDVCSGVEARPGIKDHVRLKEFILAAKGA